MGSTRFVFPFDGFGDRVGVNCGLSDKSDTFGLIRQFGVSCEKLAEQLPLLGYREPVKGEPGSAARSAHCSGHSTTLVPLQVKADDLYGHGEQGRSGYGWRSHLERPAGTLTTARRRQVSREGEALAVANRVAVGGPGPHTPSGRATSISYLRIQRSSGS